MRAGLEEVEAGNRRPVAAVVGLVLRAPGADALDPLLARRRRRRLLSRFRASGQKQYRREDSRVHRDESYRQGRPARLTLILTSDPDPWTSPWALGLSPEACTLRSPWLTSP